MSSNTTKAIHVSDPRAYFTEKAKVSLLLTGKLLETFRKSTLIITNGNLKFIIINDWKEVKIGNFYYRRS